jgi:hypothetical protein
VLTQTRKWAAAARKLQALRAGADLAQHFADPANYAHVAKPRHVPAGARGMTHSDCPRARDIAHLQDQIRELEHQLASLRYDLEREVDDRRAAIRAVQDGI